MKIFFLVLAFFMSLLSYSQTVKIIDNNTLQPIPDVFIYSKNNATLSDSLGRASFSKFNNSDTLLLQHPGYQMKIISYNVLEKQNYRIKLTKNFVDLNKFVVSANKWRQKKAETAHKILIINQKETELYNPQTAADLLGSSGEVFIQKSQMGGGSPMIRGFAANRVLIVVDGVRMNNAIFRSGNLQNVISVDPNAVENTEIFLGPGSLIYGSDALGGVMSFKTISPKFSQDSTIQWNSEAMSRYSSANNEKTGHFSFSVRANKWTNYSSVTYSSFGDLRMGSNGNSFYTRPTYVKRINGKDSTLTNSNPNIQKFSGYNQLNLMNKLKLKISKNSELTYALQLSTTTDIPRYDRLIQYKGNHLKYADWHYGPQKWFSNSLHFVAHKKRKAYDKMMLTAAHQYYKESRINRKYNTTKLRNRTERVYMGSLNLDFLKSFKNNTLYYGVEGVFNFIKSKGISRNIETNELSTISSRYPNNSKYWTYAAYINYKKRFSDKLTFNGGARLSTTSIAATLDTTFFNFPFQNLNATNSALTGSLGLIYKINPTFIISSSISSGFKAPNIDDVSKVFDSQPGNVIVPNASLKPEYAYSGEINITKSFKKNLKIELTGFYTYLDNALIRQNFSFNGQDSILYDGEMSRVQALVNKDNAVIYGMQIDMWLYFNKYFTFKSNLNLTRGRDKNNLPVRHVPPNFGSSHLDFKVNKLTVDLMTQYNGQLLFEELSLSEQNKPHLYAPNKDGHPYSPAWAIISVKSQYDFNKNWSANLGIENILDNRYRPYSSGISAPGRNIIMSLRWKI